MGVRRLQRDLDGRPTGEPRPGRAADAAERPAREDGGAHPLGASTKAELFTRLHEPPADFLALDRATLQALRDALARLPASLRATGPHERPPDGVPPHRPSA